MVVALIVSIMLIPQSLAYAQLAGLPPEVGLYASMAPLIIICHLRNIALSFSWACCSNQSYDTCSSCPDCCPGNS